MAAITAQELELQMPDASQLLSDEPEMESSLHYMQLLLLVTCLDGHSKNAMIFTLALT